MFVTEDRMMADYEPYRPRSSSLSMVKKPSTPGPVRSSSFKKRLPLGNPWGTKTYAQLISDALNSSEDKRLTLSEIYDWIVANVPYFKDKGDDDCRVGWKNSIRHNLSVHNCFIRIQNDEVYKRSWWTFNPEVPDIKKLNRRRCSSVDKIDKSVLEQAKKRAELLKNSTPRRSYSSRKTNVTEYSNNFDQVREHARRRAEQLKNPVSNPAPLACSRQTNVTEYSNNFDQYQIVREHARRRAEQLKNPVSNPAPLACSSQTNVTEYNFDQVPAFGATASSCIAVGSEPIPPLPRDSSMYYGGPLLDGQAQMQQCSHLCEPPPPYSLEPPSENRCVQQPLVWTTNASEQTFIPAITETVSATCPPNNFVGQDSSENLAKYDSFLEDLDQVLSEIQRKDENPYL